MYVSDIPDELLEELAETAYNAVTVYSSDIMEQHPTTWYAELSESRTSELKGIIKKIACGEIRTIAWLHEHWLVSRRAEGWTYGAVFDEVSKHHPNMVAAAWLPPDERNKYFIFFCTVKSMLINEQLWLTIIQDPVDGQMDLFND